MSGVGCAVEAVSAATILLSMLQREFRRNTDHELGVIFDNTMSRVFELLNSVNIGPMDDIVVDSQEIANTVFGDEWLVGERSSDGSIVVAGGEA